MLTSQMPILFLLAAREFDDDQTKLDVIDGLYEKVNLLTRNCRNWVGQIVIRDLFARFEGDLLFSAFGFAECPGAKR